MYIGICRSLIGGAAAPPPGGPDSDPPPSDSQHPTDANTRCYTAIDGSAVSTGKTAICGHLSASALNAIIPV